MIRVMGFNDVQTEIEVSYTAEVKTYNLITDLMSDECEPYRVAQSAMLWLNRNGDIGELECIYPKVVESSPCRFSELIYEQKGLPQLEVTSDDSDVYVQHHEEGYIVWFTKGKVIDSQIQMKNTTFLLAGSELSGIVCKGVFSFSQ